MTRGRCSVCGYSLRLRKDGTVQKHKLYIGSEFLRFCTGSGKPPYTREGAA